MLDKTDLTFGQRSMAPNRAKGEVEESETSPTGTGQHVDGRNIVPPLKQSGPLKRDALYWHSPNYIGAGHPNPARPCSVIRKGDWKLIEFIEDNRVELYNVKKELGEKNNLASKMPDKAKELRQMLDRWRKEANVQMPRPNPKYRPKQ